MPQGSPGSPEGSATLSTSPPMSRSRTCRSSLRLVGGGRTQDSQAALYISLHGDPPAVTTLSRRRFRRGVPRRGPPNTLGARRGTESATLPRLPGRKSSAASRSTSHTNPTTARDQEGVSRGRQLAVATRSRASGGRGDRGSRTKHCPVRGRRPEQAGGQQEAGLSYRASLRRRTHGKQVVKGGLARAASQRRQLSGISGSSTAAPLSPQRRDSAGEGGPLWSRAGGFSPTACSLAGRREAYQSAAPLPDPPRNLGPSGRHLPRARPARCPAAGWIPVHPSGCLAPSVGRTGRR